MSSSTLAVRPAVPSELEEVTALCLAAFADEAVITWVLPDPAARAVQMRTMFEATLAEAVAADTVLLALADSGAPIAVSFWVPGPDTAESPEATGSGASPGVSAHEHRLAALAQATEAARPDIPHLHLSSMAVLPGHRGHGAGGALISAGLARAEGLGLPVQLEASTPESHRLYARHGFRDRGAPLRLPGGGPTLRPMMRERPVT